MSEQVTAVEQGEDEGPWGVYDGYCLKCAYRCVSVAPVSTESVDLWECGGCGAMTLTHHLRDGDDE